MPYPTHTTPTECITQAGKMFCEMPDAPIQDIGITAICVILWLTGLGMMIIKSLDDENAFYVLAYVLFIPVLMAIFG